MLSIQTRGQLSYDTNISYTGNSESSPITLSKRKNKKQNFVIVNMKKKRSDHEYNYASR